MERRQSTTKAEPLKSDAPMGKVFTIVESRLARKNSSCLHATCYNWVCCKLQAGAYLLQLTRDVSLDLTTSRLGDRKPSLSID
jgi:hypothetical protein